MATVFILEPSTQHQPSSSSWRPDTRYFLCVATLTLLFFCRNWPRLLCHFKEEFWRHNQTVYIAAPSTQTRSSPAGGQVNIYISTISTIATISNLQIYTIYHIYTGYDYPQNLLRNVARAASLTHYTASLDVDVLLAPGMTRPLATFLNGNTCSNCVFVIPTYEVITTHL